MDRLQLMNVYLAVAEEGGFARGARRLGISPPTVTRAIAALEQSLGVKLLQRTTRHVRVTEIGQRYLEDLRRVLAELAAVDAAVGGENAAPRGRLSVTAPVMFGRLLVMPAIVDYLKLYPATEISALFLDRDVNLLEEGIDIAVRIGQLTDSSMHALAVGSVRQVVCASPGYLSRHGEPRQPADLSAHTLISTSGVGAVAGWRFKSHSGTRSQRVQPRLQVSSNDAALSAALADFGIVRLLSYQVGSAVARGELQLILEEFEPEPKPIHVVHREGRTAATTIRSFIDFIVARLRADRFLA